VTRSLLMPLVFLAVVGCASAPQREANTEKPEYDWQVSIGISETQYNNDWKPVEDISMAQFEFAAVAHESGLGWEIASAGGEDDTFVSATGTRLEVSHGLLGGGLRYTWVADRVRPYIGAGAEFDFAEIEVSTGVGRITDDDMTAGLYVHLGVAVDIDSEGRFFAGVDGRYGGIGSEHDFDDVGLELDSNYTRVTGFFGFRF